MYYSSSTLLLTPNPPKPAIPTDFEDDLMSFDSPVPLPAPTKSGKKSSTKKDSLGSFYLTPSRRSARLSLTSKTPNYKI